MSDTTTRDAIDIKEQLNGATIADAIAFLTDLAKEHPEGTIEISTDMEYGESYAAARLNFTRPMTPLEIEVQEWDEKARTLEALKREAAAFAKNGMEHPRSEEIEALRKELGFFAIVPMRGTLTIHDGEVLVWDMSRGARRRDGTWVLRTMMGGSMDKIFEQSDAEYRF
jgi:hypothetical protein